MMIDNWILGVLTSFLDTAGALAASFFWLAASRRFVKDLRDQSQFQSLGGGRFVHKVSPKAAKPWGFHHELAPLKDIISGKLATLSHMETLRNKSSRIRFGLFRLPSLQLLIIFRGSLV